MIKIHDNALLRLRELRDKHKKNYVRLDVKGGGCAGFNYEWSFADEDRIEDVIVDDMLLIDTEQVHLKKYEANGQDIFKNHCDVIQTGPTSKRFLVFIMYLSDVEEGGETTFPEFKVKPKKGSLLLFPATWNYVHSANIPKSNDKYIITGWMWRYTDIMQ